MAANDNDEVIVGSTIDLAHNLGPDVIAEEWEIRSCWTRYVSAAATTHRVTTKRPPWARLRC